MEINSNHFLSINFSFHFCIFMFQKPQPIKIGEEHWGCPFCPKIVKSRSIQSIARHIITHTGDQPYSCEVCGFSCNRQGNLKRHMKQVHREFYWNQKSKSSE